MGVGSQIFGPLPKIDYFNIFIINQMTFWQIEFNFRVIMYKFIISQAERNIIKIIYVSCDLIPFRLAFSTLRLAVC